MVSVNAYIMVKLAPPTRVLSALHQEEVRGQEVIMQCKCIGMGFGVHYSL